MQFYQKTFILLYFLIQTVVTYGQSDFGICKPLNELAPPRPDLPPLEDDALRLSADQVHINELEGKSTFKGSVIMQRGEQILKTPEVSYDRNQDLLKADKHFTFWDQNIALSGTKIRLTSQEKGEMENAAYWLLNYRARGYAEKVIKNSKELVKLTQTSYTTCDPGQEVWRLQARQLKLNNAKSEGIAHHVTLRLFNTPIFYTPYLSFPLSDKRKSGFLSPNLGSSDEAGLEFSIPYYLNLAPHYDATLTPRIMTRRGLLLQGEFRYLTTTAGGELEAEYIPHDQAFNDDRGSIAFRHNGLLSNRWATDININYASDSRYFEELGNNISVASVTHLEQRADLYYLGNGWMGLGRLQAYQTLDANPAARPYQRYPQLLFINTIPEKNRQFNFDWETELVRFERDIAVVNAPIGTRIDIKPMFSYPWRTPGTFVVPKLSLRYTLYNLDNVTQEQENTPDRLLFTFSTDAGLFFERQMQWLKTDLLHTLEPRIFYRYTPYHDQNDIPIFDSAEYDLSLGQLFRENIFMGTDRIDDGHQVSLALTSRLLGYQTGVEHLRAGIGQIFYFRDREVTLPGKPLETESSSSLVAELAGQLSSSISLSSTYRWNPHESNTEQSLFRIRYQPDHERILNLSYRLHDILKLEQTDFSFHWSLTPRWNALGRWNFSLPEEKTLETFFGLEYSSCCWALRAITRRYLNNIDGFGYLNGFFLQFQLKGLGGVGKKADSFLEQRIPGYYDEF